MTLLIIGIDPGTTLGYAILDDKGEFISSGSGKNISMSELINNIIYFGKPLIVGCDKSPAPSFNEKLAVKLGAKLFYPKQDLLIKEKKELINKYNAKLNVHEQDALASAVFALEKHKSFLGKIERFLKKESREDLEEDVKMIMIRNEELPLQAALKMAEEKYMKKEKVVEKQKPKEAEKRVTDKQIEELQLKIIVLEEKNKKLKKLLKDKDKLIRKLGKRLRLTPKEELVDFKETRIKHYTKQLKDSARLARHYEKELKRRDEFIAGMNKGVLVKKLEDLSQDEFEAKSFLNIGKNDILWINNPSSISKKVLDSIKGKVKIIITNKIPRSKELEFVFLKPDEVIIKESTFFAIAQKKAIEEALKKKHKDIFKSVIEEYKKKRFE
ncbi:hypothetical protein AYK26_04155 [Euryarchaeota archaeon SM23-78]|nr:MAG: hypothetical protein AYK26_04155 [Euryarchaeota archaeon SM23-78]MBW3001319.1 DUF460 domain-containing protein [Candidatus Woesearchaeota archaeon]